MPGRGREYANQFDAETRVRLGSGPATSDLEPGGAGSIRIVTVKMYPPAIVDPTAPVPGAGDYYYNLTIKAYRYFDGTVWKPFSLPDVEGLDLTFLTVSTVRIETGTCGDTTGSFVLSLSSSIVVDIAASGVGGLDTGVEAANTWYFVHLIADTTGANPTAGILSLSSVVPTFPTGYDISRRVGVLRNDSGSDFIPFVQLGGNADRTYVYTDALGNRQVLFGGAAIGALVAIDCSAFVPPTSRNVAIDAKQRGNATAELYDDPADTPGDPIHELDGGQFGSWSDFPTTATQQIAYRNTGPVPRLVDVFVTGFSEEL